MLLLNARIGFFYGGDQSWFDYDYIHPNGCGFIALHDTTEYLDGVTRFTNDEYLYSVNSLYDELDDKLIPIIKLPIIPYYHMNYLLNYVNETNDISIKYTTYSTEDISRNGYLLYSYIEQALEDNHPVIFYSVGMKLHYSFNGELFEKTADLSDHSNFNIHDIGGTYRELFRYHYVTITGILKINNELYLRVQSWGDVYYLKYDEMFDLGNCIFIVQ